MSWRSRTRRAALRLLRRVSPETTRVAIERTQHGVVARALDGDCFPVLMRLSVRTRRSDRYELHRAPYCWTHRDCPVRRALLRS